MAAHVLGWIAGICLTAFFVTGMWMAMPVMWNPFRASTSAERADFTSRRARVPFRPWCGLGLVGVAAAAVAIALRGG